MDMWPTTTETFLGYWHLRKQNQREPQGYWYLRDPTAVISLNLSLISSAIWKVMTWLPVTLVTFPVWPGYWRDLGLRQNLPSKCLCLGQMVIPSSWILDKCWIPALAMINLASVTSLHFDKWQLAKWADISALHSESKTCSTSSLLEPHGLWSIS